MVVGDGLCVCVEVSLTTNNIVLVITSKNLELPRIHCYLSLGILKDKSKYPTLTRMSYCQCRLKNVFTRIFQQFGWKHIALILDRSDLFSLTVGKILENGLKREGLLAFVRELDGNENDPIDNYLRDASMYARVVILSVRGILVRKFMLAAHRLGMTKGDWTFFDVEIFQGSYWGEHDWNAGDSENAAARKAYEALLRVSLLQPTSDRFQDFADKVKQRSLEDYNYTISEGEEVNFVIGAFYDGVYLLGMALNETLWEGGDIRNGLNITTRMWDRDFLGITGHVRIDDNGDRDADYSLLDLDPITGKFEVVGHYNGLQELYSPVPGKKIHWPGGQEGPPPDIPRCGFMDNNPDCRNHGNRSCLQDTDKQT